MTTYSGLESCILNHGGYSCETEYSASQASDSQAGDELSCSSSSKGEDSFASSSPGWPVGGGGSEEECGLLAGDWAAVRSPYPFYRGRRPPRSSEDKEKVPIYSMGFADVESMKEKFARLLLGEDGSGGRRGVATAVALSNAISNLAGAVANRPPGFFLPFRSLARVLDCPPIRPRSGNLRGAVEAGAAAGGEEEQVAEGDGLAALPDQLHGGTRPRQAERR